VKQTRSGRGTGGSELEEPPRSAPAPLSSSAYARYPLHVPPEPDEEPPASDPGQTLPEEVQAQLRAAAVAIAEWCGGDVERAEREVLHSALELTKDATVLQYTSVLASRRARRRLRESEGDG